MDSSRRTHIQVLKKLSSMTGEIFHGFEDNFTNIGPDKFVNTKYHLLSRVRGIYVPANYDLAYTIKLNLGEDNYKNEVIYEGAKAYIKYYMPNKEKDNQKARDILAIENNYYNNVPLGVISKKGKKYSIIGIGEITSLEDDYIHITCETSLEEITKSQKQLIKSFKVEDHFIIKSRLKQGFFRTKLLEKYDRKCALCDCKLTEVLVASHIKPWAKSNNIEKLDENNGLLLCANHDSLFDPGLISFDAEGRLLISKTIDDETRSLLNVNDGMSLNLEQYSPIYMEYHRHQVFKGQYP